MVSVIFAPKQIIWVLISITSVRQSQWIPLIGTPQWDSPSGYHSLKSPQRHNPSGYALYSWLSLSRTRLSRITAYLEVKILSLLKHENLTTGKKYCGKEEKLLLRSNFSSFPQYFQYISDSKSPVTHIFVKCGCSNYFFLNSANLICRGTDISKYFKESLGIRDNESRLYMFGENVM